MYTSRERKPNVQRPSEVRGLEWADVVLTTWSVTRTTTKRLELSLSRETPYNVVKLTCSSLFIYGEFLIIFFFFFLPKVRKTSTYNLLFLNKTPVSPYLYPISTSFVTHSDLNEPVATSRVFSLFRPKLSSKLRHLL